MLGLLQALLSRLSAHVDFRGFFRRSAGDGEFGSIQLLSPATPEQNENGEDKNAISTDLGMQPLMERVLSRREILKA